MEPRGRLRSDCKGHSRSVICVSEKGVGGNVDTALKRMKYNKVRKPDMLLPDKRRRGKLWLCQ